MGKPASIGRSLLTVGCAPFVLIGGCSRETAQTNDVDIATAADAARGSVDNYAALPDTTTPAENAAPPAASATPAARETGDNSQGSAAAAAETLTRYYSLIGEGSYAQAWRLWDRDGQASEMDEQSFAASFAKFATYSAQVGPPGRIDAGAGQRYITVPVRVSGRLRDGNRPFAMEGPVTLHRAGDIDGATSEQLRWRISSSGVRPRPDTATSDISTSEVSGAMQR